MENFNFDEAFRNMMESNKLKTVVVQAHINPDGDAAGSVMGLSHYLRVKYPEYQVLPYLSDKLDKGPKRRVLADPCFDPFVLPVVETPYAAIVCDTATRARIAGEELYEAAVCTMVLDHHASNEGYGTINNRKISESCSENIYYMMDQTFLKKAVEADPVWNPAEYIYLGMVHDTNGFDRADPGTMEAAAALMKLGVSHKACMKTLKTDTFEDMLKRMEILKNVVRVMDGKVAYSFVDRQEKQEKNIEYADIHAISGILRDCEDIELGFTMYEEAPDLWRCSFRSDGKWINVNEMMLPLGGGGHAGASGLRKKTDQPKQLLEDILNRVCEMKNMEL
ncbi:MAG: DHH family phosphoesterase [Lachnospiraceae bacterium]|nr:DHH family phosphoesterase [Lachnospiraceae bacterium]